MKLISKFNQINEQDSKKIYKKLVRNLDGNKRVLKEIISDFDAGTMSELLKAIGKDSNRLKISKKLKAVLDELNQLNV